MADTEKNAKQNPTRLLLGVALLVIGLLVVFSGISSLTDNKQRLITPSSSITVEIVNTPELRSKGLSGRAGIGDSEGMLFVFDDPAANNCFWMKDMNFSIDMVWIDEDKRVITITPDVSPDTYPSSFCPVGEAKYGLELSSGNAERIGLEKGEKVRF